MIEIVFEKYTVSFSSLISCVAKTFADWDKCNFSLHSFSLLIAKGKKSLRFIPIFFVIVSFHIFTFNAVDDVENPLKTLCSTIEYLIWEFKRALVTEKMSKLRILSEVL